MPSSLPIAGHGPIDLAHLRQSTFGDARLEREVLGLFEEQLERLLSQLMKLPPDAGALAHTLKGSARAIGAFAVAEAASALELTIRDGTAPAQALADLDAAVTSARVAVAAILLQP